MTLPWTIIRALFTRIPISSPLFQQLSLTGRVEALCRWMKKAQIHETTICGVGKFPSCWLKVFRQHGITIKAFLDINPCWHDQYISGIPVLTPEQCKGISDASYVIGLSSLSDSAYWRAQMQDWSLSLLNCSSYAHMPEKSSLPGTFDLLADHKLDIYSRRKIDFSEILQSSPPHPANGIPSAECDHGHESNIRK